MAEFAQIPSGWNEIKYEVGEQLSARDNTEELDAVWVSTNEKITVTAHHNVDDDGRVSYPIVVEQKLEDDNTGVSTTIQSHARIEDDRMQAERMAIEFMHEVNDGMHTLHLLGVEQWEEFYNFYCVSDTDLPGSISGEELIEMIDNEQYDDDIEELPDDFSSAAPIENTIQIDVFPRLRNEVDDT